MKGGSERVKNYKNTTVGAAILSISVSSDVMNKAGMCGKGINYITGQPFSALHWSRAIQHGGAQRSLN